MIMIVSQLFLAVSLTLPASFVAPKRWIAKSPPAGAPINFIWLSPHFGVNGDGENLSVLIYPVSAAATLDAEVHRAIKDLSQDRMIVNSHTESTCHGRQAGWTFEARLPMPNGKVVSQVYHVTIVGGRAYTFTFTHAAGDRIAQAIVNSIQSICPSNKPS